MPNDLNIINDLEEGLLTSLEGGNIADFITHEACKEYYSLYNKTNIPTSFIRFIFSEYKRYTNIANKDIRKFFSFYKETDIPMIVLHYQRDQFALIDKKKTRPDETYYHIKPSNNLNVNFGDEKIYGLTDPENYTALRNICEHITHSDELVDRKELYVQFMMKEYLTSDQKAAIGNKSAKNKTAHSKKSNATTKGSVEKVKTEPEGSKLSGKTVELPSQKGKVVKIFFAKFDLPTIYPTPKTKSRLNLNVNLSKLMKPDDQLKLINSYKINGVKYSQAFIDKRKQAAMPAKKKFNFDF